MKEVQVQKMMIDAVVELGGFAYKLSNRFTIGVCDLYIALRPGASLIEVKLDDYPVIKTSIIPGLTPMQEKFLKSVWQAGQLSGVATFLDKDGILFMNLLTWEEYTNVDGCLEVSTYQPIGRRGRVPIIGQAITKFHLEHN